jgi:hypothetical protein
VVAGGKQVCAEEDYVATVPYSIRSAPIDEESNESMVKMDLSFKNYEEWGGSKRP